MTDVFLERRVEWQISAREKLQSVFAGVGTLVAIILVWLASPSLILALLVSIALGFGYRHYLKRLRREYEYALTNGELDIDVIFNREWRKRRFSLRFPADVSIMAKVSDERYNAVLSARGSNMTDCTSGCGDDTHYFITLQRSVESREQVILWTPSPEMVQACRRAAPSVVHP